MRLARGLMGRFRVLGPDGRVLEQGEGDIRTVEGALVLPCRPTLRVVPGDITALAETAQPYGLHLGLSDGTQIELTMLGRMRGQLFADLRDARSAALTKTQLAQGVGKAETFPGALDDTRADIQLYDDALVIVRDAADPLRVPYSFITDVTCSDYRIEVRTAGHPTPLTLTRLGRRTTELHDLLNARLDASAVRTSTFLGALVPSLGSLQLRALSARLRDGRAAPRTALDAIDPNIWPALLTAATLPGRRLGVDVLARSGELWLGFKQIHSVERPAQGVEAWHDSTRGPNWDHGPGGAAGYGGMFQGMILSGGPSIAMWLLGTGAGPSRSMTPRADVTRGRLTPATTDYAALTVTGDEPPVLAFLLCHTPNGRVAYEVLNRKDHATYVFHGTPETINQSLDLIGFHVSAIYDDTPTPARARTPALQTLRTAFQSRVIHTDTDWQSRLTTLL